MTAKPRLAALIFALALAAFLGWRFALPTARVSARAGEQAIPGALKASARVKQVADESAPVRPPLEEPNFARGSKLEADPYVHAEVLSHAESEPDQQGRFQVVKVVKGSQTSKYPLLRIEETQRRAAAVPQRAVETAQVLSRRAMVADHLIVRLRASAKEEDFAALNKGCGAKILRSMRTPGLRSYLVEIPGRDPQALPRAVAAYTRAAETVAYAEPDYVVHALGTPNDTRFGEQWALNNTGQTGGTADADIDAPEAWNITTGSASVKVGVIDTGVDYTHPDLASNIWANPGEIPGNGIDDDGNGYIDDVHGWDFANDDHDPLDDNLHGTHVAGTIGARGNNGTGVTGICWNVTLMALKFIGADGSGYTSDAVDAVYYATRNGARVTSNSWGGGGFSQALKDAIDDANAHGILFIAAAGNEASDNDQNPSYPSSFTSPNIIAVASTDRDDRLSSFSNYGLTSVDLAAPGSRILSTFPTYRTADMDRYGFSSHYEIISGTSMATPHVAGAVALLWAYLPSLTISDVRQRLLQRVDRVSGLVGKVGSGGRLNLFNLVDPNWVPRPAEVVLAGMQLDPESGNGNGYAEPGETLTLTPAFMNLGQVNALNVTAQLISSDPLVTLLDGSEALGTVAGGLTVTRPAAFRIQLSPATPDIHHVDFTVVTTDGTGHQTVAPYGFYVSAARPQAHVEFFFEPGALATDPTRSMMYLIDLTNARLLAIDMTTCRTIKSVPLANSPGDIYGWRNNPPEMAISLDGSKLYVPLPEAQQIQVFSLPDLASQAVYNFNFFPISLACGQGNMLYASAGTPGSGFSKIHQIDGLNGTLLSSFNKGALSDLPDDFADRPLIRASAGGSRLYVGEILLAVGGPLYFFEFDITGSRPVVIARHPFVAVYLNDFVVDEQARRIYATCAWGSDIQVTDMTTGAYLDNWMPLDSLPDCARAVAMRNGDPMIYGATVGYHFFWSPPSTPQDVRRFQLSSGVPVTDYLWYARNTPAKQMSGMGMRSRHMRQSTDGKLLGIKHYEGLEYYQFWAGVIGSNSLVLDPPGNHPPSVANRSISLTEEASAATIDLAPTDADGDRLTTRIVTPPAHGEAWLNTSTGQAVPAVTSVMYKPANNFFGTDTFQVQVMDATAASNVATITVQVQGVNDAPFAWSVTTTAYKVTPVRLALNATDADNDPLTYSIVAQPQHGSLSGTAPNLVYTPAAGFSGIDSFTYKANDGTLDSNSASVFIIVKAYGPPGKDFNGDRNADVLLRHPSNGDVRLWIMR